LNNIIFKKNPKTSLPSVTVISMFVAYAHHAIHFMDKKKKEKRTDNWHNKSGGKKKIITFSLLLSTVACPLLLNMLCTVPPLKISLFLYYLFLYSQSCIWQSLTIQIHPSTTLLDENRHIIGIYLPIRVVYSFVYNILYITVM